MSLIPLHNTPLYIGGYLQATDRSFFLENNIQCVVNVTKDVKQLFPDLAAYHRIPVNDDMHEESFEMLFNYLWDTTQRIRTFLDQGKPVLVHCQQGIQRSCAIVAAYLVRFENRTVSQAVEFIRTHRNHAFLGSVNFQKSLDAFAYVCRQGLVDTNHIGL